MGWPRTKSQDCKPRYVTTPVGIDRGIYLTTRFKFPTTEVSIFVSLCDRRPHSDRLGARRLGLPVIGSNAKIVGEKHLQAHSRLANRGGACRRLLELGM
jgi:hypothetical protein